MSSRSEQSLMETETLVWSAAATNADKTDVFGEGPVPVFQFKPNVRFPSVILTWIYVLVSITCLSDSPLQTQAFLSGIWQSI